MKKMTPENQVKSQVKDYLALKGIFSFPITQGMGSYPGLPDRVMHVFDTRYCVTFVHYLEIKAPNGKLSDAQKEFQSQCEIDGVYYHTIRSVEEIMEVVG